MAAGYWIKLYQDILKDPKMGRLSDSAWRRCIELFLMAGEQDNRDGFLPAVEDVAWELRVSVDQLNKDLAELERAGILTLVDGRWLVANFKKRQAAVDGRERVQRHREKKAVTAQPAVRNEPETNGKPAGNESVTKGYADKDIDKELEKDTEGESPPPPAPPNPFPFVPSSTIPAVKTVAQLRVEAIISVCGLDPDIPDHVRQAENTAAQLGKKYAAEFIHKRYSRPPENELVDYWNWFEDYWLGQKGEQPKPRHVVETISLSRLPAVNGHRPAIAAQPKGLAAVEEYARRQQGLKQ